MINARICKKCHRLYDIGVDKNTCHDCRKKKGEGERDE